MRIALLSLLTVLTTACVTGIKVQDQGPVQMKMVDAGNVPLAPLVLQYKFDIESDGHELLFLDENKTRFQMKVPSTVDTSKGIVVYLPAGRAYALNKMIYIRNVAPRQQEFLFGGDSNFFKLDPGVVTYIGYFEVSDKQSDRNFRIHKPNKVDQEARLEEAKKNLGFSEPIKKVENYSAY